MKKVTIQKAMKIALHEKQHLTKKTLEGYTYQANRFLEFVIKRGVENYPIRSISQKFIQYYFSKTQVGSTTPVKSLKAIFAVLEEKKIISTNPVVRIQIEVNRSRKHVIFSKKETAQICAWTEKNDLKLNLCILLLYYCCMRPVEVTRLQVRDIDFENSRVKIRSEVNLKSKRDRILPAPYKVIEVIERVEGKDYVLGERYGESYFNKKWQRMKEKIEVREGQTLYGFKHTGAVRLYESTKDIILVKEYCGHQNVSTTMRYLRSYGVMINLQQKNLIPDIYD